MIFIIMTPLLIFSYFFWQNLHTPSSIGVVDGQLAPPPWTPNCVSSDAENAPYAIDPLPYSPNSLDQIEAFFLENYITIVAKRTTDYLHLVVVTPRFRFRDDLQFLAKPEEGVVKVRSSARVGYSDLGKNRERIEALRAHLKPHSNV